MSGAVRIVLATCRPKPALTASDGHLAEALRRAGATVLAMPWDEIDPGREDGLVCLRSTWDYHQRWDEFLAGGPDCFIITTRRSLWMPR